MGRKMSTITLSEYAFIDIAFYETMSGESVDEDQFIIFTNFVTELFEQIANRLLKKRTFSYLVPEQDDTFVFVPEYSIFDGKKGNIFWFPTYPLYSIDKFIISDVEISEAAIDVYDSSEEYYLYKEHGKLVYYGGFDFGYNKNIKTKYTAGYDEDRKEYYNLQQLTYLFVKHLFDNEGGVGSDLISEKMGNYSYTKMNPQILIKMGLLPPLIYQELLFFKRYAII
jgi:hypothetical protein